jgi:hypothetical protein
MSRHFFAFCFRRSINQHLCIVSRSASPTGHLDACYPAKDVGQLTRLWSMIWTMTAILERVRLSVCIIECRELPVLVGTFSRKEYHAANLNHLPAVVQVSQRLLAGRADW